MSQRERSRQRQQAKANAAMQSDHLRHSVPNIQLNIDELILDGVPTTQRYQVAYAVQHELAAQLSREGLPKAFGSSVKPFREVVDGGVLALAPGARAETIGGQLAGAIYRSMAGEMSRGKK